MSVKPHPSLHPETIAVHAGRHIDPGTGAVATPIHLSTIFERDEAGLARQGFDYGRDGNPNRAMLETCLAALEGGAACIAFGSGMAAITTVVECLPPDLPRRLLLPTDLYNGLQSMLEATGLDRRFATETVDMADLAAVQHACAASPPGLVWIETPSNPLLQIVDIAAVARTARAHGAISIADNTFATPILQRPLALGADLVVQSATKFIGGSSDLTLGAVIAANPTPYADAIRRAQIHKGAVPSPFDCWLALRSIQSLVPRMRLHCSNAAAIARHLAASPRVHAVHYPGLATHPGHAIARSQMSDFGGMLSIEIAGGQSAARSVAAAVRLFTRATSFGDAHSLIEPKPFPDGLLRLSIGLEHAQDLIDDLDQALAAADDR